MERKIILNQIQTPDGTILISHSVHDYKEYKDSISKEVYMVDGGNEYLRRNKCKTPYKEMTIYSDDDFKIVRENLYRGSFDGYGNRLWIKMSEMSDDHIMNCIKYNIKLGFTEFCFANQMYKKEFEYRAKNNIFIEDKKGK